MRSVEEIRHDVRLLYQDALSIRDKLRGLVADLQERREVDRWSCAEDLTILQIARVEANEIPLSYWHYGFLKCVEEGLTAELEEAWRTFEERFRNEPALAHGGVK